MIGWNYLLVGACLLFSFLLYKEWTRQNKSFLYARLFASLLGVGSLLWLAHPPAEKNIAEKNIAVITSGFVLDSLEHLFGHGNSGIPVFSESLSQPVITGVDRVHIIADWKIFSRDHDHDTMHIFGNGLSSAALAALDGRPFVFHATAAVPAVTHVYWKQHLPAGETLTVQGHYENTTSKKIKLFLQAFGQTRDSVDINAAASVDFSLHTIPLHTGRAVYSFTAVAGNDTLQKEPVPVAVSLTHPLQLLMIASSPDFENTYLKNHLSQLGYQVSVSTTVANNKKDKQFINTGKEQAEKLTLSYLYKFDAVIADAETLQKMSAAELAAIRAVVQEKGTGLVIKIDTQYTNAFYARWFPVKTLEEKPTVLLLNGMTGDSTRYKITTTNPAYIVYTPGTQVVLQDTHANAYAAATVYGSGKIMALTLQNTYSMALAGDKSSYQQLWWQLLNSVAKKIYPQETWQSRPFISQANDEVYWQADLGDSIVPKALQGKTPVYLQQDLLLPFRWHAAYWPKAAGWRAAPGVSASTDGWYVFSAGDWQSLTDYDNLLQTKKYAALHPVLYNQTVAATSQSFTVNQPLLLLILFLSCCIFLWVEQKAG